MASRIFFIVLGLLFQVFASDCKPLGCGSSVCLPSISNCIPSYPCNSGCYGSCGNSYTSSCSSPISFLPVPQPVPVQVPSCKPQSVTIPNIIVALLPPNQNKVCRPVAPAPIVLPVPQPCPVPVSDCGSNYCGC